ncbi:IclR family transcriptional regulator [Enterobacter hormaechei]|uniref:IclR family transcriptional regulator n=1 Tax=Enterobacter TaxID=547 RepID=UPI000792DAAA|nr:IclR family transcriptional regulator [Enterobacter hormaechei]MBK4597568.1 IclR family transcriptional regulator [Enterobacter hormaechei]MCL8179986.1 IclR family transcriptional regulator [Enterobacter hormaechei]MCM7042146.1 IclR family transcriptional regulator [Enterobacter hormaechei]MCM7466263.1 IclR family transcriptional regulator [Enterobacter hormaechei]MCW4691762.1 IclR family transcriptional regulator [Enterobacter hormaechei subsp. hoffmannii]
MTNDKSAPGKDPAGKKPATESGAAAVDRAFAILAVFDKDASQLTLAEIARRTGFYKSTILRLLSSLEKAGFVRKSADGRYCIGPEPLRLSSLYQASFRLRDVLLPHLEHLSDLSGETSSFYIMDNDWRVILYRVEPRRAVRVSIREGDRFSVKYGASGKILSAFTYTDDPIFDEVREKLWAESYGERDPETASVSVPVFGVEGVLQGALTLSGPRERFTPQSIRNILSPLFQCAIHTSKELGGDYSLLVEARKKLSG